MVKFRQTVNPHPSELIIRSYMTCVVGTAWFHSLRTNSEYIYVVLIVNSFNVIAFTDLFGIIVAMFAPVCLKWHKMTAL